MQKLLLSVGLLLSVSLMWPTRVLGLPGGAPAAACGDLTQQHSIAPQTSTIPYEPVLDPFLQSDSVSFGYIPGNTYTLTFQPVSSSTFPNFQGFLWQARLCADDSLVSSNGFGGLPSNVRPHSCTPPGAGVTHTDTSVKGSITVQWVAPVAGSGAVQFAYAACASFSVFWPGLNVRSPCIQELGATPTPPTTTQTTSTPTPTPDPGSGSGDEVEIGFDQLRYSVDEGDNLYLCVSVQSGYLTDDVIIHFSSDYNGYISATAGEDYTPFNEYQTLYAGSYQACITVYTLQDYGLEGLEEFHAYFYIDDSSDSNIEITVYQAYIVIVDDDIVKLGFEFYQYEVNEFEGSLEVCLVLLPCPYYTSIYRPVQLAVRSEEGNATAGSDFEPVFELVTFHIGAYTGSKACFTVYIESDSDLEELELFTLHLYSSDIQVYIPEEVTYAYVIILDVIVECPELDDPEDGSVSMTGVVPGDTATYECDEGFATVGDKSRMCLPNGEWSGEAPECIFFEIGFDDDTPYVSGNEVTVSFFYSAPLLNAFCQVQNRAPEDCTSGSITFTGLPINGRNQIFVSVSATAPCNETSKLERGFRVDTNGVCSSHQINEIYSNETTHVFQFQGTGPNASDPVNTFDCSVRTSGGVTVIGPVDCTSPYFLATGGLGGGAFTLRIRAGPDDSRCAGSSHRIRNIPFTVDP